MRTATTNHKGETMKETRTITVMWLAASGIKIGITMIAQYGLDLQARRKTSGRMELSIDIKVDGISLGGMVQLEPFDHPQCVAKLSNGRTTVGLSQDDLERYNAAKSELQAWIADNNAQCDRHEAELAATSDRTRDIERHMQCGDDF